MIIRILLFAALVLAVAGQDCGGTWKRYGDTCYLVKTRVNVWGEARKDCQQYSGDLATVKDQGTHTFLVDLLDDTARSYWIGGHDKSNEGNFEWIDNTAFDSYWTGWGPGQPDDFSALGEDCVELDTADGNWNDLNCVVPRYYICARDISTPIKCSEADGWREYNGKCYLWVTSRRKFQDAEIYCQLLDGNLPALDSQGEQDFLSATMMAINLEYWIGLTDLNGQSAGDYSWTDPDTQYGTGYYMNWAPDQPKNIFFNGAGDCAAVDDPEVGQWTVDRCDQTKRHFCERMAGTCATGWKMHNGQCYQVNANNKKTWTDAKHYCEAQGGYLITIMNDAENQYIASFLPELRGSGNSQIYIGISDTEQDGNFKWVHTGTIGYTNWNDHQPIDNRNQDDCGSIYTGDLAAKWDTMNCYEPTGFICKIQVGRPVTDIPPDQVVGSCDNGWQLFGDSCYYFSTDDKTTWGASQTKCEGMGGNLLSVHGSDEQSYISTRANVIRERLWIGFHDTGGEGNFVWSDDSALDFFNWAPGEPNNAGGEDCTHLTDELHNVGMWNDNSCDNSYNYICKKDKYPGGNPPTNPPPPTPILNDKCGQDWEYDGTSSVYDGKCYRFAFSDYMRWSDAVHQCRTEGGDLVSISGYDEQNWLTSRIQYTYEGAIWIGASDLSAEGGFEWSDGAPFRYINWNAGEPNNVGDDGEHCTEMYSSNGYWNDNWCSKTSGYICKQSPVLHHYYYPYRLRRFDGNQYYKLTLSDIWPNECADACMLQVSFDCKSFDYDRTLRVCSLSDVSSANVGLIPATDGYPYDHFERDMEAPPLDPITTVPPMYGCPSGWKAWGQNCYFVNPAVANYADSRTLCTMQSAELASIATMNENNFLLGFVHEAAPSVSRAWIGLNDLNIEMYYEWTDNSKVTYTAWNYYEPNNAGGEDCVEMNMNNGLWNDLPCTGYDYNSICKRPRYSGGTLPAEGGCASGWKAYMSSCYWFVQDETKTWSDAKMACEMTGGHLAVINDKYENGFVSGQLGLQTTGQRFWIGLSDIETPGFYKWVDGSPVGYTNWGINQPDDSKGKCVGAGSAIPDSGFWMDLNCEETFPYTCEKLRDGYTTVPPENPGKTNPSNTGCSKGWIGYGSMCYHVYEADQNNQRRTWDSAQAFCSDQGGDLASFHSPEEETYIRDSYEANDPDNGYGYWIGLNDRATEGIYEWSDGTPVEYTNWEPGEPNDSGGTEECVEAFLNPGRAWNDLDCGAPRHWICRIPKGTPPVTPSPAPPETKCPNDASWAYRHPHCYWASAAIGGDRRSWGQADEYCKAEGGYLASIHSAEEQLFVSQLTTRLVSSYWIGLREYSEEGIYTWSDGTALDYVNWNPGEPNDAHGEEQCAEMEMLRDEGRWNDNACGIDNAFICKRPYDNTAPVTNAPTVPPEGGCPSGWYKLLNKCYTLKGFMEQDRANWFDARDACAAMSDNGNLATLHNKQQQAAVTTLMRGAEMYDVWIGLSDLGSQGKFHWTDGSDLDFTNWGVNQPDGSVLFPGEGQIDCVEMMNDPDHPGKWNDVGCTDTLNAYLCQMPLDPDLPDLPPQVSECTMGSDYLSYFNQCFKLVKDATNYANAKATCEEESTTLATISNGYDEAFVEVLMYTNVLDYVWIGLNDMENTGVYKWLDGWPVFYTNWGRNEPSMREGEGCVRMTDNPDWEDTDCSNTHPFVCKVSYDGLPQTPKPPKGYCLEGWKAFDTYCYLFELDEKRLSWPDAQYACSRQNGGQLVSIHNKAQNTFISDNARTAWGIASIWLGLKKNSQGGWEWDDRSALDYVNWANGEPNGDLSGENCGELYDDEYGKWNDEDCFGTAGYVCQMKQLPYPPDGTPGTPSGQTGLSAGGIVGIVIGILIIAALVVLIGYFIVMRNPGGKFDSDAAMAAATSSGFDNTLYATSSSGNDKSPIVSDA